MSNSTFSQLFFLRCSTQFVSASKVWFSNKLNLILENSRNTAAFVPSRVGKLTNVNRPFALQKRRILNDDCLMTFQVECFL